MKKTALLATLAFAFFQALPSNAARRAFSPKYLDKCQLALQTAQHLQANRPFSLPSPEAGSLAERNPKIGQAIFRDYLSLSTLYATYAKLSGKKVLESDLAEFYLKRHQILESIANSIRSSNLSPKQQKVFLDELKNRNEALKVRMIETKAHLEEFSRDATFSDLANIDILFRSKLAEIVVATRLSGVIGISKKYTDYMPADVFTNLDRFEIDIVRSKPGGIYEFIDVKDNLPYPTEVKLDRKSTGIEYSRELGLPRVPNEFIVVPPELAPHLPGAMQTKKKKVQLMRHATIIENANKRLAASAKHAGFPNGASRFELGYLFLVKPKNFSAQNMEEKTPVDHVYTIFPEKRLENTDN